MKVALLHRYPKNRIKETNAAFHHLEGKGIDVLTFKKFDRTGLIWKHIKSFLWIFYAPILVIGRGYETIYCDDSYPFYPAIIKIVCPKSKVIIRLGDFHLMYYFKGKLYDFLHFFEKITWMMVDGIIVISQAMADKIAEETLRYCDVVLDPVDPKDFLPMGEYRSPYEPKRVMFHGLLTKNKNVDVLIQAARLLPEVDFMVVGGGPDFDRLMKISPKNVIFPGWIPFRLISHYIETSDIGVALRSDNPGNEYVVTSPFLQYGIMGKPCLVTRRKVFGDYKWQFSGADELVEKIKELMKNPFEEGHKLKEYILEHHNAEKIAEEIWHILT